MFRGIKFTVNGLIEAVDVDEATVATVLDATDLDAAWLTEDMDAFIDNDSTSDMNVVLSAIAQANGHAGLLRGDGIVIGTDRATGTSRSLTNEQIAYLVKAYTNATAYIPTPVPEAVVLAH